MIPILSSLVAEGGVWFDPKITLGSVLMCATFLVTALFAWRDLSWRVKNSENWQDEHNKDNNLQRSVLDQVREAVTQLRAISEGQEIRIRQMEDRMDRYIVAAASVAKRSRRDAERE